MVKFINKRNINVILFRPFIIISVIFFVSILVAWVFENTMIFDALMFIVKCIYNLIFSTASKYGSVYMKKIVTITAMFCYFIALGISVIYERMYILEQNSKSNDVQ